MTATDNPAAVNGAAFDGAACDGAALDAADPLAHWADRFLREGDVIAYLDGNSLGRPLAASRNRIAETIDRDWGARLIRSWDETWMELPLTLGDRLGAVTLGAAAGQTVVADSTTVMLYKLARAALTARRGRSEIVLDDDNFPTDRYIMEGIARECGLTLRWITVDRLRGVTAEQLQAAVGQNTALVVLSHVSYRSGYLADAPKLTQIAHDAGALMLWDLCHSVGSVPLELDSWGVDLAVGCTYKYLNGGPGSPAFGYVRRELQGQIEQPIQGWMGAADSFAMGPAYRPAVGMRRFISGTPPILGMLAMQDMLEILDEVGMAAVRTKSIGLTEYAIALFDELLSPLGVTLSTPRDSSERGSHVTISHPDFRSVTAELWESGIIPDYRAPDGIRLGLSPLSTSFAEVKLGIDAIAEQLRAKS